MSKYLRWDGRTRATPVATKDKPCPDCGARRNLFDFEASPPCARCDGTGRVDCADDDPAGECKHVGVVVEFDEAAARGLSDTDVRARWPRFCGECTDCGCSLIKYASTMHYVMGDW